MSLQLGHFREKDGNIMNIDGKFLQGTKKYGQFRTNPYGKEKEESGLFYGEEQGIGDQIIFLSLVT